MATYQDNALPNILTIGDPAAPTLVLQNASADKNGDGVVSIGGVFGVDVIGDTLSIDEVDAVVQYGKAPDPGMTVYEVYLGPDNEVYLDPDGESVYSRLLASTPAGTRGALVNLRALPYGTPVKWQCDARTIAAFYLRDVSRVGRYLYRLAITSGVGLLDREDHPGGVYTGQTFETVALDIIGGRFPVTVASALADQPVYGWLPYDTRRNNLHQLLFALGASLRRDPSGAAQIVFLTAATPASVPDSRITFGGEVVYDAPATRAEVTEHGYFAAASDEEVTLFDNTNGGTIANNTLVVFGEGVPVHDLAVTGTLSIDSSGVNWARVSGVGELTGKRYTHVTRVVSQDAAGASGQPNVKHVENMTLVSLANSLNVAKRVLAYYSGARTVRASLMLQGERCGDVLSMDDPYFDPMQAFLESITVNASTDLWGPAKLIEGYMPQHQGNNVTGSAILTGIGVWPSPITGDLTVIVISGAQGGSAGSKGNDAPNPSVSSYNWHSSLGNSWTNAKYIAVRNAKAGKGGAPGTTPGTGGRIYSTVISVTEGQEIAYACGVGGAGEVYGTSSGGSNGTDTIFGDISSASGQVSPGGFIDPISGNRYAITGEIGMAGGDGVGWIVDENNVPKPGPQPSITIDGVIYSPGGQGANVRGPTTNNYASNIPGGFGGGVAYKANGFAGLRGYISISNNTLHATVARGGQGATALAPPKAAVYGQGGTSGNGGGGGGAVGAQLRNESSDPDAYLSNNCFAEVGADDSQTNYSLDFNLPTPALGGNGSDGGEGGDGVILLYWGG